MMTVGSLFSGIGGIEKGLEQTGHFKTIWQVEIDEYATKVLKKHWPNVKRYGDIRTIRGGIVGNANNNGTSETQTPKNSGKAIREAQKGKKLCDNKFKGTSSMGKETDCQRCDGRETLEYVDLICGGFPCQDISNANPKGKGLEGSRSGLWFEFARIIGEVRPKYVLVENVPALTRKGLDRVLGSLAEIGYDAEWDSLRASDFGYPHRRERIFIVAYASGWRGHIQESDAERNADDEGRTQKIGQPLMANPELDRRRGRDNGDERGSIGSLQTTRPSAADEQRVPTTDVADTSKQRMEGQGSGGITITNKTAGERLFIGNDKTGRIFQPLIPKDWVVEPRLDRVVNESPHRVDRLKCIGNAVVPACAEWVGRMIWEYDKELPKR